MGLLLTPLYIPKIKELSEEVATLRSQVDNASKSVEMANNHVNTNSNPNSKYDIFLSCEVTKRVYFIGNERMLIDHDSNRLRFS